MPSCPSESMTALKLPGQRILAKTIQGKGRSGFFTCPQQQGRLIPSLDCFTARSKPATATPVRSAATKLLLDSRKSCFGEGVKRDAREEQEPVCTCFQHRETKTHRRHQAPAPIRGSTTMADLLKKTKACGECGAPDCDRKCACKLVYYCDKKCQNKHWCVHKWKCMWQWDKNIKAAEEKHGKDGLDVAVARWNAGQLCEIEGRYGDSERYFLEAQRIAFKNSGTDCDLAAKELAASCLEELGKVYRNMDKYDEAVKALRDCLGMYRERYGDVSTRVADILKSMGDALYSQGNVQQALATFEESLKMYTSTVGPEDPRVAGPLTGKADCYSDMGRTNDARKAQEEAVRIKRLTNPDGSASMADSISTICDLGNIYIDQKMYVKAMACFEDALGVTLRVHGKRHPTVAAIFHNIAIIKEEQGKTKEALRFYGKALKIQRRVETLMMMGILACKAEMYKESLEMLEEVLAIHSRVLGPDAKLTAQTLYYMALTKDLSGDVAGALQNSREAKLIFNKLNIVDVGKEAAANDALVRRLERKL